MVQLLSTGPKLPAAVPPPRRIAQAIVTGGAVIGGAAVLAALALWFHYGTAVFFETLAAGISACF